MSFGGRARALGCTAIVTLAIGACTSVGSGGPDASTGALGPGCLGAPNASCTPYPQGTVCPGPPTVCVACGTGIYTLTQSDCICTTGTWTCDPPAAGAVVCPNPVGQYVDPACTVLYPGPVDSGVDAGVDAGADSAVDAGVVDAEADAEVDGGG